MFAAESILLMFLELAGVAELADALDSKSEVRLSWQVHFLAQLRT
jgi:hypothetical protein